MRIYLNTSALSWPSDDLSRSRARHEAEAVSMLVAAHEARQVAVVTSECLAFEPSQHADQEHTQRIATPLRLAKTVVGTSASVPRRARTLEQCGLRGLDALHISRRWFVQSAQWPPASCSQSAARHAPRQV